MLELAFGFVPTTAKGVLERYGMFWLALKFPEG